MKKLAIVISLIFLAGIGLQAQTRPAKNRTAKSYKSSESGEKKSETTTKTVKIEKRKPAKSNRSSASQGNRKSSAPVISSRPVQRPIDKRKKSVNNVQPRINNGYNNKVVRPERHPVSIAKTPRINDLRIRHGYIDYSNRHLGYSSHRIITFPMRVRYPFYQNYNFLLLHSYRPQVEYPWAIYESDNGDQTASIEGQVIDVDYNRRTNQFILNFGRRSPFQSATVIIPDYLSRYLRQRDIKKLTWDYVSIYGRYTNIGNVPTILVDNLDEFFVNEIPLRDFIR